MSDIAIDLSGFIALLVFFWSAIVWGICGGICALIAYFKGSAKKAAVRSHSAFGFFVAAVPLGIVNLIAFGLLAYFIDSIDSSVNGVFDMTALYAWAPLQPIIWVIAGFVIKKWQKG